MHKNKPLVNIINKFYIITKHYTIFITTNEQFYQKPKQILHKPAYQHAGFMRTFMYFL